jgi:hypothetical protein
MIRELADFERELDQVDTTPDDLVRDGFGENPSFHAFVAEWDAQRAAYILYFFTYSTWAGRPSLFLEDLFISLLHTSSFPRHPLPDISRTV